MWPLLRLPQCFRRGNENLMSSKLRIHSFCQKVKLSIASQSLLFISSKYLLITALSFLVLSPKLVSNVCLPGSLEGSRQPSLNLSGSNLEAHCPAWAPNTFWVTEGRELYELTLSVQVYAALMWRLLQKTWAMALVKKCGQFKSSVFAPSKENAERWGHYYFSAT